MKWLLRSCSAVVLITAAACKPGEPQPDGGHEPDSGRPNGCAVAFTHRAQSSASSVVLIGEWNAYDRLAQPLKDPGTTGTWSGTFSVPPGKWAYAFLENGQQAADLDATYIRYVDGKPWSALHVADCNQPTLTVETANAGKSTYDATFSLTQGDQVDGTLRGPDGTSRALTATELTLAEGTATVALTGLADGKYRLTLTPKRGDVSGESVGLPFWAEAERFTFRDSPMYMAMIDRFRDGDPSNNSAGPASTAASFRGGDLQGLEQSIRDGYFDALSVKAIWVSPWQTQPAGAFADGSHSVSGYHGYWPVKARDVDARYGGKAALKSLVLEAHKHGIRIVMDAVLNHVHIEHEYFQDPAKKSWFRTGCTCGSSDACGWDNAAVTCLFRDYMPDINWTNNDAADQFVDDMAWWVDEFDLDGIRVDAVKHVEDSAIVNLAGRMRAQFEKGGTDFYMFGETFTGDSAFIRKSIGPTRLDAQLNFPMFMTAPEAVFGRDDQGLSLVRDATAGMLNNFGDAAMVNFVGNHDVARFITKADPSNRDRQGNQWDNLPGAPVGQTPYDRLFLSMANLMTIPGVPLIYYGDEYGEYGGADPDNRHFLNREATYFPEQRGLIERMKRLLAARAKLRGLRRGPQVDLWCNTEQWGQGTGNLYAYARTDADPKHSAVVVLNLTGNTWTNVVLSFPPALQWQSGTLREALSQTDKPFSNSTVSVDVPARGAVVLHLQ